MKKFLFGLLIAVTLVMVSFPLLLVWQPLKYTEKSVSPNGNYTVVVKHSDGQWPFGPAKVKVSAKKSWLVRKTYWTEIADDGGQGQIEISWPDEETAQVILHGDEQRDEIITATFSNEEIQIATFREEVTPTLPSSEPTLTPEPSPLPHEPVNIEVDVGDGEHTFWVEVVDTGEPAADCNKLLINIYQDETKRELFQTFESWWADPHGLYCFPVEDMDFDGDMDFSVCNQDYRSFHRCSHYFWDEEEERFVEDPYGLNRLTNVEFDGERRVVRASNGDAAGQTIFYYRYQDGALVCIRTLLYRLTANGAAILYQVEDLKDGALTMVYESHKELGNEAVSKDDLWPEEFERWLDLDYCGE